MLGAHITDSRDLKDAYFDILASATKDQSVGVRKAALKIVWEAYMATTACMKAGEACGLLLQHVADPEESIQDQVAKYFHGFWFCADHSLGKSSILQNHSQLLSHRDIGQESICAHIVQEPA